jgi:arsenate reductase (thioredoxin)
MTTVLFACVHNAGRSQMAAAWFNLLSDATSVRAISAGTDPDLRVQPEVVTAMAEVGVDLSEAPTSRLTPKLAQRAKMLITMGCGDQCPVIPGLKRDDWQLEDPKGKPIDRVREIRDEIRERVEQLLEREGWRKTIEQRTMVDLPIACTLSPDALQVRRQGLLADLLRRAQSHEPTPDGVRVAFSADGETLATIARVVDAERQCCRFLRFVITVAPDGGPIVLELSGPAGTREFLAGLLEL